MPFYIYEAINSMGQQIRDEGLFDSAAAMYLALSKKGLTLVDYRRRWFTPGGITGRRVKRMVAAEFLRNLAMIISGGVTLLQALEDFLDTPLEPALKKKLKLIHQRISEGFQLSEAIEEAGGFSPFVVVLARIGEESGSLDRTLQDAADHLESIQDIINRTRSALSYPIFVLIAMGGALGFWLLYVFPQMLELFKGMGITELPLTTTMLIGAVNLFKVWWPIFPAFLVALGAIRLLAQRHKGIKFYWDLFWMKMPLFGTIIRASQFAFFFEYLSLLTRAGIDIVNSMEIMAASVSNQVMRQGLDRIKADVMAGHGLTDAFRATESFEPFIIRLVSVGEQTGNMPVQLKVLGDYYMKKVRTLVNTIAKTIEPVMIVFAGGMFVIIAMGLLGPIYDLMTRIQ
jgi:type II secretory pathway component PulF